MSTLVLTSDFPSTCNQAVVEVLTAAAANPRVVWISPETRAGLDKFPTAQAAFHRLGFENLEYCDIDEKPDWALLGALHQFDAIYLSGGDPLVFRQNILRAGLGRRLHQCWLAGRVIVAASGGAMQLTANVSLFRLLTVGIGDVLTQHEEHAGLRLVPYELLPHLNRLEAPFIDVVRRYSEKLPCDVLALSDGAAVVEQDARTRRVHGQAVWVRRGVVTPIESTS